MSDGLLVGRFQPFHLGHLSALRYALGVVDRLWVGIGSSNRPMEPENPFTAAERRDMIVSSAAGYEVDNGGMSGRISTYEIPDVDDHKKWLEIIDALLPPFDTVFTNDCLTAHLYSRRRGIRVMGIPFAERDRLSGTHVRDMILRKMNWQDAVPRGTRAVLEGCGAESRLARIFSYK